MARFPDFIIAGAMKSGTTSLHLILSSDPRIFIPKREIFFFDMDDLSQHPDFFFRRNGDWLGQPFLPDDQRTRSWYADFFSEAREGQWIGEDSTTYLASHRAPERIATFLPEAKVIVLLRDPASRTYSHYWHLVRTGRATMSFEDALQYEPGTLLHRSIYKPQVERFLERFRDRLRVLIFEDFVHDAGAVVNRVYEFLGVPDPIDLGAVNTHHNEASVPRWPSVQLWWNGLARRHLVARRQESHLPNTPPASSLPRTTRLLYAAHRTLNPLERRRPPSMNPETRGMLNSFFKEQNAGLDGLIGQELSRWWYRESV